MRTAEVVLSAASVGSSERPQVAQLLGAKSTTAKVGPGHQHHVPTQKGWGEE